MSTPEPSGTVAETTLTDRAQDAEPEERRSAPNSCMVIHDHGSEEIRFSRETVEELLAGDRFFWLDLDQPEHDDYEVLREVFKFHPLAVEDSEQFGQRAKLDDYDDFVFLVVYGAVPDADRLVEVHCFYSESSSSPSTATTRPRSRRCASATRSGRTPSTILAPALPDRRRARGQLLPDPRRLRRPDRRVRGRDFLNAGDEQLQEIFQMKRLLVGMRKAITPQRDMFATWWAGSATYRG